MIAGCPDHTVPCLNQTDCLELDQVCIGNHQCVDQQGHEICHHCQFDVTDSIACVTSSETRLTFECLSPNQICDGTRDCVNNDDEDRCGIDKCAHDSWLCKNGTCIKKDRVCDTHRDCPDGSDEEEICHSMICGSNKFRCRTGECISKSMVCDGVPHCPDGIDEENCPHVTSTTVKDSCSIPSNTFVCSSSIHSQCISNDRVCDGYQDCPMGDDERNCNEECIFNSKCPANSNLKCLQHPVVDQLCRCTKEGYRWTSNANTQTCEDFDECKDSLGIYCSFNCMNTNGSFNCTCPTGFTIDQETKTCRKINNQSQANLLILHDDNISLYNIWNLNDQYSLKQFKRIPIGQHHYFDRLQYDPNQMFLIYYDQDQHGIFCKSSLTFQTRLLLSNITVPAFAYNANEKSLFLIENQSRTLRMYTPITCEISQNMKMHSWNFNHTHSSAIQSMEMNMENRQFIFATQYDFLVSNMSEPNATTIVYSTDRKIKRFIYDPAFQRIFWTTVNRTHEKLFFVHTCDEQFRKCLDTSVVLPVAWPFAFFNDGLLFPPLSSKSLDFIQIYGKTRFSERFLTSTKESIHSFLFLSDSPTSSNLCTENSCKDQLCLQINPNEIKCLSIDENLIFNLSNNIPSNIDADLQSLMGTNILSQAANQRKKFRYQPSNMMLFSIVALGILVAILAFFVKRCHKRLNQRAFEREQRHHERCLANDEPNLDEFNVVYDNRVSKERADYAREILLEYPNFLLVGRRRDSV